MLHAVRYFRMAHMAVAMPLVQLTDTVTALLQAGYLDFSLDQPGFSSYTILAFM